MSPSERRDDWWELRLRPDPGSSEQAAEVLLGFVPAGLFEDGGELVVYLPNAESAGTVGRSASAVGSVSLRPVAESAWRRWREHFVPVRIGERLEVVPLPDAADTKPDPRCRAAAQTGGVSGQPLQVFLEPGAAFGTGEHPTTAACLRYLERVVRPGFEVLDVGTGSGVLAVAAALLGASRVLAVDSDPASCRAAGRNLALNPGAGESVTVLQADAKDLLADRGDAVPRQRFDLLTANLHSTLLKLLAGGCARAARAHGWLVASGIGWENRLDVEAALAAAGFSVRGRTVEAGWVTVLARRRGG